MSARVPAPIRTALLRAYKACLAKADPQMRDLLAEAFVRELREGLWLHEEFVMPRGARLEISLRVTAHLPELPPESLRIAGPKP